MLPLTVPITVEYRKMIFFPRMMDYFHLPYGLINCVNQSLYRRGLIYRQLILKTNFVGFLFSPPKLGKDCFPLTKRLF